MDLQMLVQRWQIWAKVAMALGAAVHVHVADKNAVTRWRDKPSSRRSMTGDSQTAKPKSRKKTRKPL